MQSRVGTKCDVGPSDQITNADPNTKSEIVTTAHVGCSFVTPRRELLDEISLILFFVIILQTYSPPTGLETLLGLPRRVDAHVLNSGRLRIHFLPHSQTLFLLRDLSVQSKPPR